jgi:hypothetical protein
MKTVRIPILEPMSGRPGFLSATQRGSGADLGPNSIALNRASSQTTVATDCSASISVNGTTNP